MSGRIPTTGSHGLTDAAALMHYDANKRSVLVAYVLWFVLGWFAAHRLYAGRIGSGIVMLVVSLLSWALTAIAIGYLGLLLIGFWLVLDAFLIPGMVRSYNRGIIASLGR